MPQISLRKMWKRKKSLVFPNDRSHQKTIGTIILIGSSHMLQLTYLHINWSLLKCMVMWIEECECTLILYWTRGKQDISGPIIAKMSENRKVAYTAQCLLISNLLPYQTEKNAECVWHSTNFFCIINNNKTNSVK